MNAAAQTTVTLQTNLGQIPMTFSDVSEEWCSCAHHFEIENAEWFVEFSLDEKQRVALYAYNHDGASKFSPGAYTPSMSVETALRYTLGI